MHRRNNSIQQTSPVSPRAVEGQPNISSRKIDAERRRALSRSLIGCALLLGFASATLGCASAPPPPVLHQASEAAASAQAKEAEALAPQAFAHAEQLRARAEQAHADGHPSAAELLGARAIAAYSHAFILARLARAEQRLKEAEQTLGDAQAKLSSLDTEQAQVAREADALELQLKVARDALPLVPSEPASPARELARLESARALTAQARLLCVSAWLLNKDQAELEAEITRIETLATELNKNPRPVPIDAAIAGRTQCLKQLTSARSHAPASAAADQLLSALSARGGLEPKRDDRGIVVTLRDLYRGQTLAPDAKERLAALVQVAKSHPAFPLLLSVHEGAQSEPRLLELKRLLEELGAPKFEARAVGDMLPLVPPSMSGASSRNNRVELTFVVPTR